MLRVSIQCISITIKGSFLVLDLGIYGLNYTAKKYGNALHNKRGQEFAAGEETLAAVR